EAEAAIGSDGQTSNSSGKGIGAGGRDLLETDRGAVAGESPLLLTYLCPTKAQTLEDMVTAQANAGPGQPHPAFAAGESIGRAAGAAVVQPARGEGFSI